MGNIGYRIKEQRNKIGMTETELSEATGIHKATISAYEHGLREPSSKTLPRLAMALGCSIEYLCELTDINYDLYVPKGINMDLSKLNEQGLVMITEFYNYLCSQEKYTDKEQL